MTQQEANRLMIERFKHFMEKAQNADSEEDSIRFTDAAHKLYITLPSADAFQDMPQEFLGN